MHIFLNALGASTASGLTYLRNVLPDLDNRPGIRTTVAVRSRLLPEFAGFRHIAFANLPDLQGTVQRFWFEQVRLPALLRDVHAEVLISAGNFALRKSPIPQILLSGNSLYTSGDFYRDLIARREYWMWLDTRVKAIFARKSVRWADSTVAPTRAFADELGRWTGKNPLSIHHGFDRGIFFSDKSPVPAQIQCQLDSAKNDLKLLYVSHYNYFRNFETLFRALPLIRESLVGKKVRLFLTCKLEDEANPGSYQTKTALRLIEKLGIRQEVVELGTIPYKQLHHVYRSCDLYVTSSYAETFAHPLIEAKACGLPIVASDLPVHREVCGKAALYFSLFSPGELATRVLEVLSSGNSSPCLGSTPSEEFSWRNHVDEVIRLAADLVRHQVAA